MPTPSPAASTPSPTPAATASPPVATLPRAPSPPHDAPGSGEQQPGGAGDEEAAYVPAAFSLDADGFEPREVSVPGFLQIEVIVTNRSARTHSVTVQTPAPASLRVPAQARRSVRLGGQRPGRYTLRAGAARATLIVGVEPGP